MSESVRKTKPAATQTNPIDSGGIEKGRSAHQRRTTRTTSNKRKYASDFEMELVTKQNLNSRATRSCENGCNNAGEDGEKYVQAINSNSSSSAPFTARSGRQDQEGVYVHVTRELLAEKDWDQ